MSHVFMFIFYFLGHGRSRRSTIYSGREDYLNQVTYLFGSQGGKTLELSAGVTSYSFACALPESVPSSFDGKYGNIRYICKAIIDRPSKPDKEYQLPFIVIKNENLNLIPELSQPYSCEIVRHFYFCCIRSKPIFISVKIPISGYIPGQKIDVTVVVNNQSNTNIEGIKVSLERNTQFISQTPIKKIRSETLKVKEAYGNGISKCGMGEIKMSLIVPQLPPTNLNFCKIIIYSYQLRITAKATGAHHNPHINIPINIGTIPISLPSHLNASINESTSTIPSAPPESIMNELPPPSYEEATHLIPEVEPSAPSFQILNK